MIKQKLYFIGGSKGVGKSTVIKKASELSEILIINTGNFYLKDKQNAEESIVKHLLDCPVSIVDTHYAGHISGTFKGEYKRGMKQTSIDGLAKVKEIELVLITLPVDELLERRINDSSELRDTNRENTLIELEQNFKYFKEYCMQLERCGYVIINQDFNGSVNILRSILR